MYYLLMYDDEMGDCIHWATFESLEDEGFKRITNDWHNQGVGYKIIKGEIVEDVPGIVFGEGEDIWEPVDDILDEQSDDEAFDYEPDYNDSFYDDKIEGDNYPWIDNDRPY